MSEYINRKALLEDFRIFMAENFDREKCASAESCNVCETKCLWYRITIKAPAADVVSRAAFDQVMWERDVAMEQLQEHGIPFGGKADVMAVVRCSRCKHWTVDGAGKHWCHMWETYQPHEDVFCCFGERRNEDD